MQKLAGLDRICPLHILPAPDMLLFLMISEMMLLRVHFQTLVIVSYPAGVTLTTHLALVRRASFSPLVHLIQTSLREGKGQSLIQSLAAVFLIFD